MGQNPASNSVLQDYFQIARGTKAAQELITWRQAGAWGPINVKLCILMPLGFLESPPYVNAYWIQVIL